MMIISKTKVAVLGVALIAVAAAALVALGSRPQVAHAQATPTPSPSAATVQTNIGVSGLGRVSVQPDTAVASIGVDITAPTLEAALQEADEKMTAVVAAIRAQGVDPKDIQTTSYNVFPITNVPKEGESSTVTGYRVSNQVTVKVRDIDKVGEVLDAALGAGANSVNSVFFLVDDPSKAQDEARTLAVKDAMAKAATLASAAGVEVGRIISISDTSGGVQPLFRTDSFQSMPTASGAGPIETGSTEVTATVEMHFEIAQ